MLRSRCATEAAGEDQERPAKRQNAKDAAKVELGRRGRGTAREDGLAMLEGPKKAQGGEAAWQNRRIEP
jgi:hypothetical protein